MNPRPSKRQLDAEARLRPPMQVPAHDATQAPTQAPVPGAKGPRLQERLRTVCRLRHYSRRTEDAYWMWARQFILFHGKRHPLEMGAEEVRAFLTHLAVERNVSASTQAQALNALVFLYEQVLGREAGELGSFERATRPKKVPVVLAVPEVRALLGRLEGTALCMAQLLYGAGLRILECARLRVKDVDFARNVITLQDTKGGRGPGDDAAGGGAGGSPRAAPRGANALRCGPGGACAGRAVAGCLCGEVPLGGHFVELVLDIPITGRFAGSAQRRGAAASCARG